MNPGSDTLVRLVTHSLSCLLDTVKSQCVFVTPMPHRLFYLETTAKVLAATIGFLAIYQDEQDKAYKEIISISHDRELVSSFKSFNPY